MYEALTAVYNEANTRANEQNKEKIFSYVLLNADFNKKMQGLQVLKPLQLLGFGASEGNRTPNLLNTLEPFYAT